MNHNILSRDFLKANILSKENINDTINILNKLEKDKYGEKIIHLLKNKPVMDLRPTLNWLSKYIAPKKYMEVGIRTGYSMACVTSFSKNCEIYGFDMWIKKYAGVENPGKKFVLNQLKTTNYKGKINFIDGNTKHTLPSFFEKNNINFDLITIDGDHSFNGAKNDLNYAFEHCNKNGAIVLDDVAQKAFGNGLSKLWKEFEKKYNNFKFFCYHEPPWGVGIAFKIK
jgi:predicted O-methyltransferase YrrM